ncbi:MAG: CHRD domain-containing protein, partial [Oxalobacteraceae bacterium]
SETFADLSTAATGAHIHCCVPIGSNAGIAIPFTMFPFVTSGTFAFTFDLLQSSTYTAGFMAASGGSVIGARDTLVNGLAAGQAYANIHDAAFPGGEIRGQLAAVPEPASWVVMLSGFGVVGGAMRGRRKRAVSFG